MSIACTDESAIDELCGQLEAKYPGTTVHTGANLSFLGMLLDFSIKHKVRVTMPNYEDAAITESVVTTTAKIPAGDDLFEDYADSPPISSSDQKLFHSRVMRLLYLAKRTRLTILTAVSHLASLVASPNQRDWSKLTRIFGYLLYTKGRGIGLSCDSTVGILCWIDASHAVHSNMRSQVGVVVSLRVSGGGPIMCESSKLRLNTKSSHESELVALSDNSPNVFWCRVLDRPGL